MNTTAPGFVLWCRGGLAAAALLMSAGLMQAQPLLKNPELKAESPGVKSIAGWQLSPASTGLAPEAQNLPEGVASALRVTVSEVSAGSGSLTQRVVIPASVQKLVLTGYLKSDQPRGGYIEVKLYKGKQELVRLNGGVLSAQYWQKVTINIDPKVKDKQGVEAVADKMEVLCRWYQQEKHLGGNVWFAKLELTQTEATVAVMGGSTATEDGTGSKYGWGAMLPELFRPSVSVVNLELPTALENESARAKAWADCLASKPSIVLLQCDWAGLAGLEPRERVALVGRRVAADISTARGAGVQLVLVTAPARRLFDAGGMLIAADDVAAGVRSIAEAHSVPVIDLHALSAGRLAKLGAQGSVPLFRSIKDRTNLSKSGALLMAAMVADSLVASRPAVAGVMNLDAVRRAL